MTVDMSIHFNKMATLSELQRRQRRGIMVATSELRRYSNQYVRRLTSEMYKSSYLASQLEKGLLVYDKSYAWYAYTSKDSKVTLQPNPNARPEWVDYAIQHHLKEIERTVQREVLKP